MKAIRIHAFGGPEVLQIEEVARPVPASDEILVQVYASGVNRADWTMRQGGDDLLRPFLKLPIIMGLDAAGIVAAVGSEVTAFQVGDSVYGVPNFPGMAAIPNIARPKLFSLLINQKASVLMKRRRCPLRR